MQESGQDMMLKLIKINLIITSITCFASPGGSNITRGLLKLELSENKIILTEKHVFGFVAYNPVFLKLLADF